MNNKQSSPACLPEEWAVGTGAGSAPAQSRGHRQIVHAHGRRLSPGLVALWHWAGGAVTWSLLLVHLPAG